MLNKEHRDNEAPTRDWISIFVQAVATGAVLIFGVSRWETGIDTAIANLQIAQAAMSARVQADEGSLSVYISSLQSVSVKLDKLSLGVAAIGAQLKDIKSGAAK